MLLSSLILLALPAAAPAQAPGPERVQGCVYCHKPEGDQAAAGVHRRGGIDCITCHGGVAGGRTLDAHGEDFRPLGDLTDAVLSCGECHADPERMSHLGLKTDQLALFRTSAHGKALLEGGHEEVATCLNCHGTHLVLPVSDPRSAASKVRLTRGCMECHEDAVLMGEHGVDPSAPADYLRSVHGRELLEEGNLASPGCVDCHGSHGAAPPRMGTIEMVCGHCHTPERQRFRESPHYLASLRGEMEECTSCHDNHAVVELGDDELVREDGLCAVCHPDAEGAARLTGRRIRGDLDALEGKIRDVEQQIEEAALKGLFLRDHDGYVEDLRSLRRSSAPVTHASSVEVLDEVVTRGEGMVHKTGTSLEVLEKRFRDLRIFSGVFLFVSILLAGLMLAYRREL
jgi:hypothetical protein